MYIIGNNILLIQESVEFIHSSDVEKVCEKKSQTLSVLKNSTKYMLGIDIRSKPTSDVIGRDILPKAQNRK